MLTSVPAATAADDRATLRATISAARANNQVSAKVLARLPAGDARLVRDQLNVLRDAANSLSAQLSKTSGTPSPSLAKRITTLGRQASDLRRGAEADEQAFKALDEARTSALNTLKKAISSGIPTDFDDAEYRWSAAGTHALADVYAARGAITGLRPLGTPPTAARALNEARSGQTPKPARGWAPIPGGCGLPPAPEAEYLPAAEATGPLLWTSAAGLEAHMAQLASPSPALDSAYTKAIRQASALAREGGSPGSLAQVTKRVLGVGYAWLVTSGTEYRDSLIADANLLADTVSREPVDEAKEALAAAGYPVRRHNVLHA